MSKKARTTTITKLVKDTTPASKKPKRIMVIINGKKRMMWEDEYPERG